MRSEAESSYLSTPLLPRSMQRKLLYWLDSTYPIPGSRYVGGYIGVGLCKGRDYENPDGRQKPLEKGGGHSLPFPGRLPSNEG